MGKPYGIVGGGIAGASVAYHLSGVTDAPVTVFEKGAVAGETTGKSGGVFGFYGNRTQHRMKRDGMALYNRFLGDPTVRQHFERIGHLNVATTPEGAADLGDRVVDSTGDGPSEPPLSEVVAGSELDRRTCCPHLDGDRIEAAMHMPNVGTFDTTALTEEFVARARERGASVETGRRVEAVVVEDGAAVGVRVAGEVVPCRHVVTAAGPWNGRVAATAGVDLPLAHSRAPILVLDPDLGTDLPFPFVNHVESGVYCIGRGDGTVLVGQHADSDDAAVADPGAVTDSVGTERRRAMLDTVGDLLPALADAPVVDEWVGLRSVTPDGDPIVGPTPRPGLSVVAFSTSGIQLAPAAGRLLARQLGGGEEPGYADALSLDRFDEAASKRNHSS